MTLREILVIFNYNSVYKQHGDKFKTMASNSKDTCCQLSETPEGDVNENPEDSRPPLIEEATSYLEAPMMPCFDEAAGAAFIDLNPNFLEDEEPDLDDSLLDDFEREPDDEESDPEDQSDQKRRRTG